MQSCFLMNWSTWVLVWPKMISSCCTFQDMVAAAKPATISSLVILLLVPKISYVLLKEYELRPKLSFSTAAWPVTLAWIVLSP